MSEDPPLEEQSDEELFLQIAVYNNDKERHLADAAYQVVYKRYAERLYTRCMGICKRRQHLEHVDSLFSGTIARAYKKADTYNAGDLEPNAQGRRTLAWMCRMAENMLTDHYRNPDRPSNPLEPRELELEANLYSTDDFSSLYIEGTEMLSTPLMHRLVAEAFETLDERTQHVMLETYIQRTHTPSGKAMRRGSGKLLADHLETSQDNVRRIRYNGMKKINAYVNSTSVAQRKGGKQDVS